MQARQTRVELLSLKELMRPPTPNFACTVRKSVVIQSKVSWITSCCENLLFEEGVQPPLPLY